MELKSCHRCHQPYLASAPDCPRCAPEYTWDQENFMNIGCLVLMLGFAFVLVILPILLIFSMFLTTFIAATR